MSGYTRESTQYEAVWWTGPEAESDRWRNFGSLDDALAWLKEQPNLAEWLIRQRSPHGWRAVTSGTKDELQP